jgi:CoA:oxalate CoA-transferase
VRPLEGLLVLDFSQFLAGPSAALRLADLGARVVKIERPGVGDACRQLSIANQRLDDDSVLFHTINRNKESVVADLKDPSDLARVIRLIERADVLIQSFRPGTVERFGLDYPAIAKVNPAIVYGSVTGYGGEGPWVAKPGQDLLAQALSGLPWLNGHRDDPPLPLGISVADLFTGAVLTQGLLACLCRRGVTGRGGLVEVSLMESVIDMQFEPFTAFLNDRTLVPNRAAADGCSAYGAAPYGVYRTADGYLAIAMTPIPRLGTLLGLEALAEYQEPAAWFQRRDEILSLIAIHLRSSTTRHWLDILEPADVWCAEVLDWPHLLTHEGFVALDMIQNVTRPDGPTVATTRCPIRIDGEVLQSPLGAPRLGQNRGGFD